MRNKLLSMLVLLLGFSALSSQQEHIEEHTTDAAIVMRPVANLPPSPLSLDLAFQYAMLGSATAGGVVITEGCASPSESAVRLQGTALGEVLEDIIAADPDYEWEVKDGVVNLLPARGVPDLLTVRISEFDSRDTTNVASAVTFLFALPEVRERATELGIAKSGAGTGPYAVVPGSPARRRALDVHLRDVSLLDALNALVRVNKRGLWHYREIHCDQTNLFDFHFTE